MRAVRAVWVCACAACAVFDVYLGVCILNCVSGVCMCVCVCGGGRGEIEYALMLFEDTAGAPCESTHVTL